MDSSPDWNTEVKAISSSPSSTPTTGWRNTDTTDDHALVSSAPPTECNETSQMSCVLPQAPASQTGHAQQEQDILIVSDRSASQKSSGTPCDKTDGSSCASWSRKVRTDEYVKALQEAGRYAAWAPLLHETPFLEEPSLLLGQIRFDVTAEDQRGSWLLPEELLTQQRSPFDDEGDDRQLFTNTPITEEEQQAIDQVLLQLLEVQKEEDVENTTQQRPGALLGVQPAWLEQLVLRYLYSCSFDKQKAFDLLQSTLSFRTQQLPVLESEVYNELRNMGACYWHGRDRKMRPLLVISLQRLQQLQREAAVEEKVTRLVIFCLEFFLRYLCVAGVVENWCILCDLNGTSIFDFPFPLLLRLVQLIQGSYRGRLYRFYILYAPRLFHFIAKPLVSSLPTTTAKKLRVFTNMDEWHQERRTQFAAHQLEKKYGGTAADITEDWYPFRFSPGPFEPECEAGNSDGIKTAVRWESEQALHAKVHPLVHTGVSLHTSLVWRRSVAKENPHFRYAAWLRHLPELHLTPATVEWARVMLSGRLQGQHDCLAQHLMDCQSETETAVVKFPLGTDSAEGPGKTSFAAKPQQELVNRETYYQYLAKRSVDSAAGGDASGTSSSWAVQIPPLRKSSIGAVSSTSALRMCLATPLPGSPTTNWRVGANLTGSDIAAADTLPPLSTAEGRKGSKEVNSPAELSTVCSSDGCTAVERFRPSLPRTVPGVPPATGVTEGSSDACSSSLAATEKYSHAQQSQSFTPSITTAGVTSSDACSTVSHEDRTQVSRYEYVTSQVARLDLLEASGATIIPKQMCGLPPAEVQPQQCSPLSSATCSETQEEQTSDQMKGETLGTALAHLQKQEQSYSGSSHVSALRTASQGSTELSRDAVKGNRNCIRCLEGPTQKKQPRGELPLASYFSDGSAFLSVAGAGKGVGIRRSSTLGRRPTDFTEINIRGSPIPIQSTARRVENVRAMSSSCIYKTQRPSSSAEGKRLFKGAQRRTPTSAVQAGHLFGRSRRLRLREPKLTAQALLPHPRSKVEVHVQQPKASSFLAERRTAVPPSCKTQDPTGTSRGHAIAIHSAAPAFSRAVSLHSRNHGLPSHKTNNERSWAALDDMEAKCCDNSRTSTKVQNWGKDEGPSRVQDVSLPFPSASSRTPQMRDEGMQSEPGIVQTRGRVACSGSGKPRRAVGRLLPLFLLATAVNVALCSRAPSSADLDPEVMLPGYWVTPQTSRVYHVRRVGRNDGSSAFAIDGSLTACGGRGILDSVLQRSGLQDRRAAASSAAQQKVAWLQPLYCKASQAAKTSCLPGKGQRGKSFCSAASGLLFTASHPKHPVHVAQFDPSLSGAPYNLSMRRAVRVAAVKQKSRGSIDKRFKITATGKLLYKRPGLQHHAHTKSSARRTRLRRVAALKPSQISRLLGPLRVRR